MKKIPFTVYISVEMKNSPLMSEMKKDEHADVFVVFNFERL